MITHPGVGSAAVEKNFVTCIKTVKNESLLAQLCTQQDSPSLAYPCKLRSIVYWKVFHNNINNLYSYIANQVRQLSMILLIIFNGNVMIVFKIVLSKFVNKSCWQLAQAITFGNSFDSAVCRFKINIHVCTSIFHRCKNYAL